MPNSSNQPLLAAEPASSIFAVPRSWRLGDRLIALVCQASALSVIAIFVALVVILFWQAWPAIRTIGVQFFITSRWDPQMDHREFGALTFVYGTVMTSAIAMLIAVPLGVGTTAYLSEIAPPWLRKSGAFLVELLAAIPSVVYGFWGVLVLVPIIEYLGLAEQGGKCIFSAGVILSIMIVPYVAAISLDVCQAVPNSQREGSYALGAMRWQTIWSVVLPYARPGIIGGCFLALGCVLGETMAVTMLIGNRREFNASPFAPGYSIPSVIANELLEADYEVYESVLVELGLVLLLVSIAVNSVARLLIWQMGQPAGTTGLFSWLSLFRRPQSAATLGSQAEQGIRAIFRTMRRAAPNYKSRQAARRPRPPSGLEVHAWLTA